jgi:hypothetical protein
LGVAKTALGETPVELPPKEEFVRQPLRIALGALWEMMLLTVAHVEDHEQRVSALEEREPAGC